MTQHDGGPAFPRPATQYVPQTTTSAIPDPGQGRWYGSGGSYHDPGHTGMSIRDWLAGQAMGHVISASARANGGWSNELVAETCYRLADEMLKAREVKP